MTQKEFLEYLFDKGCFVYKKHEGIQRYYKLRNPLTSDMSGLPIKDDDTNIRVATICHVCMSLGVEVPEEAKEAEELIKQIRNKHC